MTKESFKLKKTVGELIQKNYDKKQEGCVCTFVPLSNKVGVKLYRYKQSRDLAVKMQKKAAKHKLAPKVGRTLQLSDKYKYKKFGYLTEIVKVKHNLIGVHWDKIEVLDDALQEIGINHGDLCGSNVGFIGNRMVAIDFDKNSLLS